MILPELEWQIVYGRIAWVIVLSASATALWPGVRPLSRGIVLLLLLGLSALIALPGEASVAYWLSLAFQWPSGTLVWLCLVKLYFAFQKETDKPVMTPGLAALIALTGAVLYIEVAGWISLGLYYEGFDRYGAPVLALGLALACLLAVARGWNQAQAIALMFGIGVFVIMRLPTGNFWDALLDPLLWAWAVASLVAEFRRRSAHRSRLV